MGDGAVSMNPTSDVGINVRSAATRKAGVVPRRCSANSDGVANSERLIFRLATIEGMRPGEILGLQIADFLGQSLRVSRRIYRGTVDTPKMAANAKSLSAMRAQRCFPGGYRCCPISDRKRGCSSRECVQSADARQRTAAIHCNLSSPKSG